MKKSFNIFCFMIFVFCIIFNTALAKEKYEYTYKKFDIYKAQFKYPKTWKINVKAEYCTITNPIDKNVQLMFVEDSNEYKGSLEDYFRYYKREVPKGSKIISHKPFDVNGIGAYYIRVQTKKKDLGHIIFSKNKKRYVLVLKTPKGSYKKYEDTLMELSKSFKIFK